MLYRIRNGAITLGNKTILEEINFEVKNQERIAIVGRNGCGKTTLLRAIVGEVELEEGLLEEDFSVTILGNPKVCYISQNLIGNDSTLMIDEILKAYDEIIRVEKRLETISKRLELEYDEQLLNEYQDLHLFYQTIGGYSYRKEYEMALLKFGFQESDKHKKLKEFSYGQRTKISFLRLILSKPDLLLLDEPTNHLDISAIEWLEGYLKDYPKAMVVVSHDRMFLDSVCNVTYEILYGRIVRYSGNYSFYLKEREKNYEKELKDFEWQQKEMVRLNKIVERFRYKPTKASMALSKLKQIERMTKLECPREYDTRTFSTKFSPRIESYLEVLKVRHLEFGYERSLGCIDFTLKRGERLGIIGENGTGKSTFLKTLMGIVSPISGKYSFGGKVEIGYFDQNVESLNGEDTVLEAIKKEFPWEGEMELRNSLGSFEFRGDMVFQKVSSLSGGQKVKLLLCIIMRHQPNVLILDEPTNHLDIVGRETIEKLLFQYKGTIIFVSHDRYFIQKLATCLLVFEEYGVTFYQGDYSRYLDMKRDLEKRHQELPDISFKKNETLQKDNHKETYFSLKEQSKLKRKIDKVEDEIQKLENEIQECHQELLKEEVYTDLLKSREFGEQLERLKTLLQERMEVWEFLSLELEKSYH